MNEHIAIEPEEKDSNAPSARQQEVLAAVLDLMVEEGDGFSMASVARRASCSKETLYRWFGDRDGLLTATVQWQAAKVVTPRLEAKGLTFQSFRKTLCDFAASWLTVITGEVSIALNRLAVSHAGNRTTSLGNIVLENGPLTMQKRLLPIFSIGREAGFLVQERAELFRTFFGLVVADTQIRVLLGDQGPKSQEDINQIAESAVQNFLVLCGNNIHNTQIQTGE